VTTGADRPARSTEGDTFASPALDASLFQASATSRLSRSEPASLEFDSPFKKTTAEQTDLAQSTPGVGSDKTPAAAGREQISIAQATPPAGDWQRIQELWERQTRERNPGGLQPAWDPSRPAWEQPQLAPRPQPQPEPRPQLRPDGSDTRPQLPDAPSVRRAPETFNLRDRLDARTMGRIPDAKVYVGANFDPSKPVNLIVYNHGWNDTINSAFRNARLEGQMAQAPPNSILVVPAWQAVDGASNGQQNNQFKTNFLGMLDATLRLNRTTLSNISDISIVSHSAGYNAVDRELNILRTTPLYDKVTTVASLDSQYESRESTDDWIKHNIRNGKFARGQAAFLNLWTGETADLSNQQALRIAEFARHTPGLVDINRAPRTRYPVDPGELSRAPIVFQNSRDGHDNLPRRFFGHAISRVHGRSR
jgi:hypothetical protein